MFDWVLNTPLVDIGRKTLPLKKKLKNYEFCIENVRKKIVIVFRGVFRTESKIYDGAFLGI